jgi:hypothetical protein
LKRLDALAQVSRHGRSQEAAELGELGQHISGVACIQYSAFHAVNNPRG